MDKLPELYFLLCLTSEPNEDLGDGDNMCYVIGTKDKIMEEYNHALSSCEFPFIYMGRVLEGATATYEVRYASEIPM